MGTRHRGVENRAQEREDALADADIFLEGVTSENVRRLCPTVSLLSVSWSRVDPCNPPEAAAAREDLPPRGRRRVAGRTTRDTTAKTR